MEKYIFESHIASQQQQQQQVTLSSPTTNTTTTNVEDERDRDTHVSSTKDVPPQLQQQEQQQDITCPFRDSPLYRSIYVYPSPNENELWEQGKVDGIVLETDDDIASRGTNSSEVKDFWPWLHIDQQSKQNSKFHYDILNPAIQYNTELLVRDIITHKHSCLRTLDPNNAKLFYIPYLPSIEYHKGYSRLGNYENIKI